MAVPAKREPVILPPGDKTDKNNKGTGNPPGAPSNPNSGGGSGGGGTSGAEKRAVARDNANRKKAGEKYLAEAANLEAQAKALKHALKIDFAKSRDQNLTDISKVLADQIGLLTQGHRLRSQEFLKSAQDTEKATAGASEQSISNLVRERQDTMSSLLEQGAGESDTLKAMVMSARNWHANQSEVNRTYFDTMRSINSGITDLNIDTKSALAGASSYAESERERLWQDFYNRRSETFTQLGNIRGQQRNYYAEAKEMGVKPKKGAEKTAKTESEKAFMDAAEEAGKSYVNKGLPQWVKDWNGQAELKTRQSNTKIGSLEFMPIEKAEGATLRKWAA